MTGPDAVRRAAGFPERHPALAVPCPVASCRARPGEPCRTPRGRQLPAPHPSRQEAS